MPIKEKTAKFNTLSDIKTYARNFPEQYNIDNDNWKYSTFESFYQKIFKPSFFGRILIFLGLKTSAAVNGYTLQDLLTTLTKKRIKNNKREADSKLILDEQEKAYIFGDLQGSFHSMARNLAELKRLGVIDDHLKIIAKNSYIIFLGDIINKSPYSLETLKIVLILIDRNPKRVFYVKGHQETEQYWENLDMVEELKAKLGYMVNYNPIETPLKDDLNAFFETLPQIITVTHKKNGEKAYLAHTKVKKTLLDDVHAKFILFGEQKFDVTKETNGLEFLGYVNGLAKWSLLSSPNVVYQTFFKFHYDAFTELSIGKTMLKSILTLYNRDIRTKDAPFEKTLLDPTFGFVLKNEEQITKDRTIINIGSTLCLTGINYPLDTELNKGMQVAAFNVNAQSDNIFIKPTVLDDHYTPIVALQNVKRLYDKYHINKLLTPAGTPTISSFLDMIKSGQILVLFPFTGAAKFRNKSLKNMIHFRPSYDDEAKALIKHIIEEHAAKSFAFFYQDDSYGAPIAEVARETLKKHGITTWTDLPHLKEQTNFEKIITKIREARPEAIGFFSSHVATIEFINQLGTEFLFGKILFGLSPLYSITMERLLQEHGLKVAFSSTVPDPKTSKTEIAKNYRKHIQHAGFPINNNSFEGYIVLNLFADAIYNITPPFTKEKIISHFENMKNYKFKGLTLTFNPEERDLSQPVWVKTRDGEHIEIPTS